jgi:predicted Zn-dependent peptidase
LALILLAASALAFGQDQVRLRTILPNGAVILVERVPDAKVTSIQLFLSSRGTEETRETSGYRHLMEHLIAPGTNGDLDVRLETEGMELEPRTLRDAMVFEVRAPRQKLGSALKALSELAKSPTIDQPSIDREIGLIRQERLFRSWMSLLGEAAWDKAFPDGASDPFGSREAMQSATPARLAELHRKMFVGRNVALVIAGDVDLDDATAQGRQLLELWPEGKGTVMTPRKPGHGGDLKVDAAGEAIGIPVATYRDPSTAASLAVALFVASRLEHSFVTYTPSAQPGMIIVGTKDRGKLKEV